MEKHHVLRCQYRSQEGAAMCDEYYDARMKAVWRALAEGADLDEEKEEELVQPIVLQPLEPARSKPKALAR
jgi:hypothetical protein